ncbi:MAG: DUF4012 domain-containing protein [candidate division SR1 bacterium]|nr:DUF4012 domain-containing protein [candidate division SR1 bacterium]
MTQFGITKHPDSKTRSRRAKISIPFTILLLLCFIFFSFSANVSQIVFGKNKVDIFQSNLNQLAFSFRPIDKNVSKFLLTVDDVMKSYMSGDNIFVTKEKEIDEALTYIQQNKEYLKKLGFGNYDAVMNLLTDLQKHKDELFDLLGKKESQNYLVILENTNEKRPNGGFFGSFAFIKVQGGHVKTMEIVDSYYPDFIAYRTRILAPDRTSPFLPDKKIGFIAGNKFGFSDIDGKNLKDLYELMFSKTYDINKVKQTMQPDLYDKLLNQNIRGVIFVRSDMLEKLLPGFRNKIRERQFLNASIDLIRKEYRGNKKELYIKEVKQYVNQNKLTLARNVVNKFGEIANNQYLTMYLSNISSGFDGLLAKNKLSNVFSQSSMYFRDMNASYNKVDSFVQKNITIKDVNGSNIRETDGDIITTDKLQTGQTYTITISYKFAISDQYKAIIQGFEKKYDVSLSGREEAILALRAGTYNEPPFGLVKKRRETRSSIYLPLNINILNVTGDLYYQTPFYPPFANGLFYQMGSVENNTTKSIKIEIEVK